MNDSLLLIAGVVAIFLLVALVWLSTKLSAANAEINTLKGESTKLAKSLETQLSESKSKTKEVENELVSLRKQVTQNARTLLDEWRKNEIQIVRQQEKENAQREASIQLQQWKILNEKGIRQSAITQSKAVVTGKVTEHIIPYLPEFNYNPKDARFIGSPVDLIVFDGADEGNIKKIVFIEVKTGKSRLSERQQQISATVAAKKIEWQTLHIDRPSKVDNDYDEDLFGTFDDMAFEEPRPTAQIQLPSAQEQLPVPLFLRQKS